MLDTSRFQDADRYASYLKTWAGRLRSELAWENLRRYLPQDTSTRRALDVGGGTGFASMQLAQMGFEVVLLDGSEEMLAIARQQAEASSAAGRISFRHADASRLRDLFAARSFDIVVCHNLLEYLEDPFTVVCHIAHVLREDAVVSVLVRNRAGEVLRAAIKSADWKLAAANLSAETVTDSLFGEHVRVFAPVDVRSMLAKAGLGAIAEHGVRVFSDYLDLADDLTSEAYRQVFELEGILGAQPQFAAIARYIQVIARGSIPTSSGGGESMTHATSQPIFVRPPVSSGGFALGLGLTNECNLACSFCYRDPARVDRLSLEQVRSVMDSLPVRSVNLGTGENGMHPEFREILAYLRTLPVKLTITSNGHSAAVLTDDELRAFHDIEFSLDYPTQAEQDTQRGPGNWALVHEQAARCGALGIPVTFIAVMMKSNYLRLAGVAHVVKRYQSPLRVNVYQSVRSDVYALSYEDYWQGFRALFAETDVIAIGEPLVRAMAGLPPRSGGCAVSTVRVTPRATTQPCVYWPGPGEPLSLLFSLSSGVVETPPFVEARTVPETCRPCPYLKSCYGGCAGRRRIQNALHQPDFYCPIVRGEVQSLEVRMAPARELPKGESACTTIVIASD